MTDPVSRAENRPWEGALARAGLAAGIAAQPAVWATGRWAVLGEAGGAIRELDRGALAWMTERSSPGLDAFFEAVTHLGSILVTAPLAIALAAWLARGGRRARAWFVVAGFGGAALFAQVGKVLVARPRPEQAGSVVTMPSDLSFPSAHTTQAMALALVVWLVAEGMSGRARRAIAVAGGVAVVLAATSRVYLQVHYPSDVVAGLVGATAWVAGLRLALRWRA